MYCVELVVADYVMKLHEISLDDALLAAAADCVISVADASHADDCEQLSSCRNHRDKSEE